MTVHWKDDPNSLKQFCLINVETAPDPRWTTIICESQTNLLNAIKVNDIPFHSKHLNIPGCVAIDVRPCFMKLYSKAKKSSLAFYLNEWKYPGAYVFPPVKGLKNKRPVTRLDFALLYPSLIMTYNLSPDKIILFRKHAKSLKDSGKKLHEINFKFNNWDVLAWSIEYENQAEMKGLYAKVLEELLIRRNLLKKCLAILKDKKEELEKEISLAGARGEVITDDLSSEYSSISFNVACLDAKPLALKVYMNTFYGEAENSGSSFFLRALAGRVTSAGQWNIKLIADLVRSKGFGVKYGDTDSLYLVYPEGEDNGSSYLKMTYEEVLFPVVFTKKKKYYGISHRRVKIVKREQSKHFREVGKKVIDESMRLDNTRILHQIVKDVLKETINDISQIDLNEVIKTAVWKPDKNNKSVQRFISRMQDRYTREEVDAKRCIKKGLTPEPYLYEILEPGECFEYIVVENGSSDKIGDKMEYPEVVRRLGKKIDISYYLKTVVGLCALFINYDDIHQPSSEIVLEALKS
ncbi:hypothetical protein C1646_779995 [Rhizophagus diaphanus]|nr:hypothetical protein C1646_779995 [Rhizophagus diaphanus] [Rhizophagus sp. MUCL 43196]